MKALIQELKNSIEEPSSSLLEEIKHDFSQQIHTPICFHECHELVKPDTPSILYTSINIIAGAKIVFTIISQTH